MKLTKIFNRAIVLALDATTASAFKFYDKFAVRPNLLTYLTGRWHMQTEQNSYHHGCKNHKLVNKMILLH